MALWTNLVASLFDTGKPIKGSTVEAISDNITALAEGASGAPQIQTAAIADDNVTQAKILDNCLGTTTLANALTGGDGSQNIAATSSYVFPAGWYTIVSDTPHVVLQVYVSAVWRTISTAYGVSGSIISDGTNVRVYNVDSSARDIYWKELTA